MAVTAPRRIIWNLPQIEPEFRKDVNVGTEDVIADCADSEKRNVNFTITLNIQGKPHVVTDRISVKNLKLTTEYNPAKTVELPGPSSSSKSSISKLEASSSESVPQVVLNGNLGIVVGESDPGDVRIDEIWRPSYVVQTIRMSA